MWLGINDIDTEGVYVGNQGNTITFTMWASGEPNAEHGSDDAVQLAGTGWETSNIFAQEWNDQDTTNTYAVPCVLVLNRNDPTAILTDWTDWSACSVTCGTGIITRSRSCTGGCDDFNDSVENQACENQDCIRELFCKTVFF